MILPVFYRLQIWHFGFRKSNFTNCIVPPPLSSIFPIFDVTPAFHKLDDTLIYPLKLIIFCLETCGKCCRFSEWLKTTFEVNPGYPVSSAGKAIASHSYSPGSIPSVRIWEGYAHQVGQAVLFLGSMIRMWVSSVNIDHTFPQKNEVYRQCTGSSCVGFLGPQYQYNVRLLTPGTSHLESKTKTVSLWPLFQQRIISGPWSFSCNHVYDKRSVLTSEI